MTGMLARLAQVSIGVWLIAAPAVLEYGSTAADNDRIFGPIAGSLAFVALWDVIAGVRMGVVPVGAWMIVAPLALSYDATDAIINSIACGVALIALAPIGKGGQERYWGGWASLVGDLPLGPDRPSGFSQRSDG